MASDQEKEPKASEEMEGEDQLVNQLALAFSTIAREIVDKENKHDVDQCLRG